MKRRLATLLLTAALAAGFAVPASATKLMHRNLPDMTKAADRIFVGTVTEAVEDETPLTGGAIMRSMRYTFDVHEVVQGDIGSELIVRHLGSPEGAGAIPGMPVYQTGKKYLVFLLPDSDIGLTSPVGFFQGAFSVDGDVSAPGQATVLNGNNNVGVFHNVSPTDLGAFGLSEQQLRLVRKNKGAFDYDNFLDLVRKMAN